MFTDVWGFRGFKIFVVIRKVRELLTWGTTEPEFSPPSAEANYQQFYHVSDNSKLSDLDPQKAVEKYRTPGAKTSIVLLCVRISLTDPFGTLNAKPWSPGSEIQSSANTRHAV